MTNAMTASDRAAYLRAAEALERHEDLPDDENPHWHHIAMDAWTRALRIATSLQDVDAVAAHILRECVARNEELPR